MNIRRQTIRRRRQQSNTAKINQHQPFVKISRYIKRNRKVIHHWMMRDMIQNVSYAMDETGINGMNQG